MSGLSFSMRSGVVGAFTIVLICAALPNRRAAGAASRNDESEIVGNWSGESICQVKSSPCRDEKVIYRITMSRKPGKVNVSADKIVGGSPVNMGTIEFTYDRKNGTLINESSNGVWKLLIHGKTMEGTLTLSDKTLYRRVNLRKAER